jgi:mannose-binding lectin 1
LRRISPDITAIPNFLLIGSPSQPQILSNKIILTPPAPGKQRAAIWAENRMEHSIWQADVEFRASGPERGSGKLAIWLVKNGRKDVVTSSIYTVGKFKGLALVIDNYAGTVSPW